MDFWNCWQHGITLLHSNHLAKKKLNVIILHIIKGNNKNSSYLFPSFLTFCPFSTTSALRLIFHWWNCQSFKDGLTFLPNKHKLSLSVKIKLPQNVHGTRETVLKLVPSTFDWQLKISTCKKKILIKVSFRYLKPSPNHFLFLSHLIRIYERNHDR